MTSCVGVDIANHFNAIPESCLILKNTFDVDAYYPKDDVQLKFLRAYLEKRGMSVDEEVLAAMLGVILEFTLLAELRWVIWALVQAHKSPVDFDYLEYMRLRFEDGYLRYLEYLRDRCPKVHQRYQSRKDQASSSAIPAVGRDQACSSAIPAVGQEDQASS